MSRSIRFNTYDITIGSSESLIILISDSMTENLDFYLNNRCLQLRTYYRCMCSTRGLLFFAGLMEFVQVYDSTYICHRYHLTAHLSEYLEREGFPSWEGSKRIGVSLYRVVKIEWAKTKMLQRYKDYVQIRTRNVTTVERVGVKVTFNAIGYNLLNLLGKVNKMRA